MFHSLLHTWFELVTDWGYWGVVVLMAMESSIFPVPSEVVMPPAAFLAAQGKMNIWGVIAAGTFGSYVGSAITYLISRAIEKVFLVKWGKFFFITEEKIQRAEHLVHRYESGGIFFARLLPVVRHLISIPAGLLKMHFGMFSLMTVIGAFLWCSILSWYGHGLAERNPQLMENPEQLVHAIKHESLWLVAAIAVFAFLYFLMMRLTAHKSHGSQGKVPCK
ncbi:MAG: DedA family protein [Verrucomicrobia bacterium]|nr:DedA family protein [Verrucomicrobiota bacterium]